MTSDEHFDAFMRDGLRARPEPRPAHDLARQAMARAQRRLSLAGAARVRRLAWWSSVASVAASLLIALTLAGGAYAYAQERSAEEQQYAAASAAETDPAPGEVAEGAVSATAWSTFGAMAAALAAASGLMLHRPRVVVVPA